MSSFLMQKIYEHLALRDPHVRLNFQGISQILSRVPQGNNRSAENPKFFEHSNTGDVAVLGKLS